LGISAELRGPLLPTLVGFGFASVLGPTRGGVAGDDHSPPFKFRGGDTPPAPRHGGFAPWTPPLPTLVGLRFASVLGPTRGGVAGDGYSPPFKFRGGTPPTAPRHGASPPGPPFLIGQGGGAQGLRYKWQAR